MLRDRPAEGYESGGDWLDGLPALITDLLERWDLRVDGGSRHGVAGLVLPVASPLGPAMLKLSWPHPEAEHEHLALRYWGGRGAVRLLAADPPRWALLLERLDADRDLSAEPIDDACAVIGTLLAELDRPAPAQLGRLSDHAVRIAEKFRVAPSVLPRRFLDQARSLALELSADPAVDARLVHTDLHYENVLAGTRAPWLAIDPKPMAAEPAFAVAPALWNRWDEALAARDTRDHLRRRLEVICAAAGIDEDRARGWSIVREVLNALWEAERPDATTAARGSVPRWPPSRPCRTERSMPRLSCWVVHRGLARAKVGGLPRPRPPPAPPNLEE